MTDFDDRPPEPDDRAPVPHRRHVWIRTVYQNPLTGMDEEQPTLCVACGRIKDEAVSRRSKLNRSRGNSHERDWCKRLGLRRVGHHGGSEDGINALFVGQSKSMATARYPSWMSTELDKLPRSEGRIPILGILEAPGIGHKPRRLVVMHESDFIALHGPLGETE